MKAKEKNVGNAMKASEQELLSLVAQKLKGRVLFPEKVKDAKKYLEHVVLKTSC